MWKNDLFLEPSAFTFKIVYLPVLICCMYYFLSSEELCEFITSRSSRVLQGFRRGQAKIESSHHLPMEFPKRTSPFRESEASF